MADETKPAATDAPDTSANDAPPETVGAFYSRVRAYLVKQQQAADAFPASPDYASMRGHIATALAVWDSGKPEGVS